MPAYAFEKLVNLTADEFDMKFTSMRDLYTKESGDPVQYIRELAQEQMRTQPNKILQGAGKTRRILPGRFYFFKYNPKGRSSDTLPYYDIFPCVLVINVYEKYFQGINFHYLPPQFRAELMDELYRFVIAPDVKGKDLGTTIRARLNTNRVNYEFMSKRFNLRSFKPTFKRYSKRNVIGPLMYIPPIGWDAIMMMPLARFRKSSINRVWRDSLEERRRRN